MGWWSDQTDTMEVMRSQRKDPDSNEQSHLPGVRRVVLTYHDSKQHHLADDFEIQISKAMTLGAQLDVVSIYGFLNLLQGQSMNQLLHVVHDTRTHNLT
jgi:hypothetical protein